MIRKAKENDLKEISLIFKVEYAKEPYDEKWTDTSALKKIKDYFKEEIVYVAEVDNKIIGFIIISTYFWYDGNRGFIEEIVVTEKEQGKGIGAELMRTAEKHFRGKNVRQYSLFTSKKAKALMFYKKLGLKEEGFISLTKEI